MTQTFWEIDSVDPQPPAAEPQAPAQEQQQLLHAEPEPQAEFTPEPEPAIDAAPESLPEPIAVSIDDFSALEERIVRAVELVRRERQLRTEAEQRAALAESQLAGQSPLVDKLNEELRALRAERDQVRQRVERLLTQLDALEL